MNIVEFAAKMGVSTATISRAFSDKGRISPVTRSLILQKAEELNYRPNLHARNMVLRKTNTIAFVYATMAHGLSDYYVSELSCGISDAINHEGMYMQVHTIPPNLDKPPEHLLDIVFSHAVDGIIINLKQDWTIPLIKAAQQKKVPYIILDNTRKASDKILSLSCQIKEASTKVGAYFNRLGCRYPGFIHGIHDRRKLNGFVSGLSVCAENLLEEHGGSTFNDGYEALHRLLGRSDLVDCVYCANDVLALGAIRAAKDLGKRIPTDIAIVGCDDVQMSQYTIPALTTIKLPIYQLGSLAVVKLLSQINGKEYVSNAPPLSCNLIIRESA